MCIQRTPNSVGIDTGLVLDFMIVSEWIRVLLHLDYLFLGFSSLCMHLVYFDHTLFFAMCPFRII